MHLLSALSISPAVNVERKVFSRREDDLWYRFCRAWAGSLSAGVSRDFGDARRADCRATGPAILVCNHTSSIDPLLLQAFSPRLIRWMMAKEYFEYQADAVGV